MKKVAVVQDLSSFGKCSLTAAIPVLSVMGIQACPLPTAVLSAQTDYPSFFYEDLTEKMPNYFEEWGKYKATFDGIYTGFVTGRAQIDAIFDLLAQFKTSHTKLLVDPIMGDQGEAYKLYKGDMLSRMRALVEQADIITPNITECCLLTNQSYEKLSRYKHEADFIQALQEQAQILQNKTKAQVIITGIIPPANQAYIGNLFVDDTTTYFNKKLYNGKNYSGTGDLFASVIMGSILRGESIQEGMLLAEHFLTQAITTTAQYHTPEIEGVHFEQHLSLLL